MVGIETAHFNLAEFGQTDRCNLHLFNVASKLQSYSLAVLTADYCNWIVRNLERLLFENTVHVESYRIIEKLKICFGSEKKDQSQRLCE